MHPSLSSSESDSAGLLRFLLKRLVEMASDDDFPGFRDRKARFVGLGAAGEGALELARGP